MNKNNKEYDYIIVGAGLCGLVLAKELSKRNKSILVIEKGRHLNRIGNVINALSFYDNFALSKSRQGVIILRSHGVGGTSIISCGNAVELSKEEYDKLGIDMQSELLEAKRDSGVKETGLPIGKMSRKIMETANKLGYTMTPMPKFSITGKCVACGKCILGCHYGHKWTSRECLKDIKSDKFELITNQRVIKVINKNGKAIGIRLAGSSGKTKEFYGNKIVLCAGGINTPIILQNSEIDAGKKLFIDLFSIVYGPGGDNGQANELPMSVVCTKFHAIDGFVLSPFIDVNVGFLACVSPRHAHNVLRLDNLMGIMVKISDDMEGKVSRNGTVDKTPTQNDWNKLNMGNAIAKEILVACGIKDKDVFIAKPRGAHPGGTAAIGEVVDKNLETKMKNLFVCDASVLPFAPGLPPILSLIALTKKFSKTI